MMNRCGGAYQNQNSLVGCVGIGEMRSDGVVCPKPRRLPRFSGSSVHLYDNPVRSPRSLNFMNQQTEACDARAGKELLDIILAKGGYGAGTPNFPVASSPPFFYGSPPSRASNPLIQDAQFGNDQLSPLSPNLGLPPSPSASPAHQNGGGSVRVKFGNNPAPVRIEGFNCRRSCGISAVA